MSRARIPVRTEWFTFTLGSVPERDTERDTGRPKSTKNGDEVWKAKVVMSSVSTLPEVISVKCYRRPLQMPLGTVLGIDHLVAIPWAFFDRQAKKVIERVTYTCDALEPKENVEEILSLNLEAGVFAGSGAEIAGDREENA